MLFMFLSIGLVKEANAWRLFGKERVKGKAWIRGKCAGYYYIEDTYFLGIRVKTVEGSETVGC